MFGIMRGEGKHRTNVCPANVALAFKQAPLPIFWGPVDCVLPDRANDLSKHKANGTHDWPFWNRAEIRGWTRNFTPQRRNQRSGLNKKG